MSYAATPAQADTQDEAVFQKFVDDMSEHFISAYYAVEGKSERRWIPDQAAAGALLDLFMLEKSAYEICYEAANRPAWVGIPLRGFAPTVTKVLRLTQEVEHA
jgi:maltose alpha-D-glucosyltransferase/alpha-amylase